VLSDTAGYAPTNISDDPSLKTEYQNDLLTAFVFDEGGNFITVRYPNLVVSDGDYHITCCSPAVDAGTDTTLAEFPELVTDFDGDFRPAPSGVDIGCDESTTAMYDVDGDCFVGPGDFIYIPPCWLVCEDDPSPQWDNFNCGRIDYNCDGCIDPGDFAYFLTAWLKSCDDSTIDVPPCRSLLLGEWIPPATRPEVEAFGLPYPDDDPDSGIQSTPIDDLERPEQPRPPTDDAKKRGVDPRGPATERPRP
jgi:hypothetical protein